MPTKIYTKEMYDNSPFNALANRATWAEHLEYMEGVSKQSPSIEGKCSHIEMVYDEQGRRIGYQETPQGERIQHGATLLGLASLGLWVITSVCNYVGEGVSNLYQNSIRAINSRTAVYFQEKGNYYLQEIPQQTGSISVENSAYRFWLGCNVREKVETCKDKFEHLWWRDPEFPQCIEAVKGATYNTMYFDRFLGQKKKGAFYLHDRVDGSDAIIKTVPFEIDEKDLETAIERLLDADSPDAKVATILCNPGEYQKALDDYTKQNKK